MGTCFVFVSDKLAEEITLTIGQAFDLAYKRFLSGKAAESESEKIARLERENCELRQRLGELGALLTPAKLTDFLEKHNLKDLAVVGDSGGEGDHEGEEQSGKARWLERRSTLPLPPIPSPHLHHPRWL